MCGSRRENAFGELGTSRVAVMRCLASLSLLCNVPTVSNSLTTVLDASPVFGNISYTYVQLGTLPRIEAIPYEFRMPRRPLKAADSRKLPDTIPRFTELVYGAVEPNFTPNRMVKPIVSHKRRARARRTPRRRLIFISPRIKRTMVVDPLISRLLRGCEGRYLRFSDNYRNDVDKLRCIVGDAKGGCNSLYAMSIIVVSMPLRS
jgi:hypothetical protein